MKVKVSSVSKNMLLSLYIACCRIVDTLDSKMSLPINNLWLVLRHSSAPGASPRSLTVQNISSFSIYLLWREVMSEYHYGIMRGYKLSIYRRTSEGFKSLENRTHGLFSPEANLTGLTPFTTYMVEVLGFNDFGDGPSTHVEVRTNESCKWILLSLLYNSGKNCTRFILQRQSIYHSWRVLVGGLSDQPMEEVR